MAGNSTRTQKHSQNVNIKKRCKKTGEKLTLTSRVLGLGFGTQVLGLGIQVLVNINSLLFWPTVPFCIISFNLLLCIKFICVNVRNTSLCPNEQPFPRLHPGQILRLTFQNFSRSDCPDLWRPIRIHPITLFPRCCKLWAIGLRAW